MKKWLNGMDSYKSKMPTKVDPAKLSDREKFLLKDSKTVPGEEEAIINDGNISNSDEERYSIEMELRSSILLGNKISGENHKSQNKHQVSQPIMIRKKSPNSSRSQSPPTLYNGNTNNNVRSNKDNSVFDKDNNSGLIKIYKMPDPLTKAAIAANYDVYVLYIYI